LGAFSAGLRELSREEWRRRDRNEESKEKGGDGVAKSWLASCDCVFSVEETMLESKMELSDT
jgi:hypothetical protein